MGQGPHDGVAVQVQQRTAAAAHRRDHGHWREGDCCHPHEVEVVHLGGQAVTVCHDCGADTGFLPRREAEQLAVAHRDQTRSGSVRLSVTTAA